MVSSALRPVPATSTSRSVLTADVADTLALGRRLGEAAEPGDVVLLEGALGAGKTVLVKGLAAGLGVDDEVVSPTFVLVRQYVGRLPLVHADLYRVGSRPEVEALGLLDLSEDGVLVVEWADRAPWLAPSGAIRLRLGPGADDGSRDVAVVGEAPGRLAAALGRAGSS